MVGGFVQFAFQLPAFFKNGYKLGFDAAFSHPGLKKISILLVPATLALSVSQINIVVSNILASYLPPGSITYLFYSMRLMAPLYRHIRRCNGYGRLPTLSEHAAEVSLTNHGMIFHLH
jgi:putative peptidoglycan lipid II flippase